MDRNVIEDIAWNFAKILAGAGLLLAIAKLAIIPMIELFNWFLLVWVPIIGILVGTGLISVGTFNAIKATLTEGILPKVNEYLQEMRDEGVETTGETEEVVETPPPLPA